MKQLQRLLLATAGRSDLVLAVMIVAIVFMMILPLPLWLVDTLIAVNMTLNHIKKRGRHMKVSLDDVDTGIENDPDFIAVTTAKTGVGREVNIHELQKRLNEAMMKLSEDHRTVVTLYDVQGHQHAEISRMLGVSEGTVRSRLFYAHRQLQAYLEDFVK